MSRFTIFAVLVLTALLVSLPALAQQDVITTVIGGGPNGIPATDANLYNPQGVAVDSSGNVYIASFNQHRIFKVNTAGTISVVAGSGALGYSGDGIAGNAINADLYHPYAVAVDSSSNVYIADQYNCVVRKVSSGTITTVAGTAGSCGYSGNGSAATAAQLYYPAGVAVDGSGNLYIGDYSNCVVRKVILSTGIISTFAGNHSCGYAGDGGPATSAQLDTTYGVATDTAGNLYIADGTNCLVRKVTKSSGNISTIAGKITSGVWLRIRRGWNNSGRGGNEPGICRGGQRRRNNRHVLRLLQPTHTPVYGGWKHEHRSRQRDGLRRHLRRRRIGERSGALRSDRSGGKQRRHCLHRRQLQLRRRPIHSKRKP